MGNEFADLLNVVKTIADAAFEGMIIVDDESEQIIFANHAIGDMFGYSPEEIAGHSLWDVYPPGQVQKVNQLVANSHHNDSESTRAVHCRKKDGTSFVADINTTNVVINTIAYSIMYFSDNTQRNRGEVALRESEQRMRTFLDSTSDMVFLKDKCFRHIMANHALCRFYGASEQEIIGKTDFDLMDGPAAAGCRKTDVQTLLLNTLLITEEAVGGRYYETMKFPVTLEGGEKGVGAYIRDITERKQSEESIAAEKERLLVTMRSIGDAVIATDVKGNIILMNAVAESLTGWQMEHAVGKPLADIFKIVNEMTRLPIENPVKTVVATGEIVYLMDHTLLISRNGTERVIADSGAPIKDKNDRIIGVVIVFRDMTDKQKYLEAIQRSSKLESLGVLAGGIAHDFNNLLTGIYGNLDLARSISGDEQVNKFLDGTLATINRARALTLQLLTFAKGGSPVQKITSLLPLLQDTVHFILRGSNISYRFSIDDDLWLCNIDRNQIGQVLDNIVINAQQAMPEGGILELFAKNVSFRDKEHPQLAEGAYVKISIRDSGVGIPKNSIQRIFDPFYSTKMTGHGLGLATSYSIVNRHGGCIDIESEPNKGSTFHIFLPATTGVVVADTVAVNRHRGSGKIIVMDDEEAVRDTVRRILESLGYIVITKNSGKEAVECFHAEADVHPPLVAMIFDLTVPGGSGGVEAVREIRNLDPKIPVFVASGYSDDPVIHDPGAYGFTASIEKPFCINDIADLLEKYVKKKVE